jgi:hypothetical protein
MLKNLLFLKLFMLNFYLFYFLWINFNKSYRCINRATKKSQTSGYRLVYSYPARILFALSLDRIVAIM